MPHPNKHDRPQPDVLNTKAPIRAAFMLLCFLLSLLTSFLECIFVYVVYVDVKTTTIGWNWWGVTTQDGAFHRALEQGELAQYIAGNGLMLLGTAALLICYLVAAVSFFRADHKRGTTFSVVGSSIQTLLVLSIFYQSMFSYGTGTSVGWDIWVIIAGVALAFSVFNLIRHRKTRVAQAGAV